MSLFVGNLINSDYAAANQDNVGRIDKALHLRLQPPGKAASSASRMAMKFAFRLGDGEVAAFRTRHNAEHS